MDEGLVGISLLQRGKRVAGALGDRGAGREDAPVHRREMRCEQDLAAKLHLHLGRVPVVEEPIGVHVLVDRVEMGDVLEALARTADAGSRVDSDRVRIDQPQQRPKRQDRRGRIAAGGGNRLRALDGVSMQFGNAVDELPHQSRRLVRLMIPAFIARRVVQPEIGAEIDEGDAARDDLRRHCLAVTVRQGREDQAGAIQRRWLEPLDPRARIGQGQMRMNVAKSCACLAVAEQPDGVEMGMAGAEPQQLRAHESRGSKDGDVDHGRDMQSTA